MPEFGEQVHISTKDLRYKIYYIDSAKEVSDFTEAVAEIDMPRARENDLMLVPNVGDHVDLYDLSGSEDEFYSGKVLKRRFSYTKLPTGKWACIIAIVLQRASPN